MIFRTSLSCEYTESIMQYTSNQHKSIQDFTYIHTKGPSASYLALLAILAIYPTGSDGTLTLSGLFGLAFTLQSPIMINTQIQQKSVPIITYIHSKGPSASCLALSSISDRFPVV